MPYDHSGGAYQHTAGAYQVTPAGSTAFEITDGFEDDPVPVVPEGWNYTAVSSGTRAETQTGTVLTDSQSVRMIDGSGTRTDIGHPVENANSKLQLQATANNVNDGDSYAGLFFNDGNSNLLEVYLDPSTGDLLYGNDQENKGVSTEATGVYTAGNTATLEIRNAASSLEILVDGTVEHSPSDTFTNPNGIKLAVEDSEVFYDELKFNNSGNGLRTDSRYVELANIESWYAINRDSFGFATSFLADYANTTNATGSGGVSASNSTNRPGDKLEFDGTDDVVNFGRILDNPGDSLTLNFWIQAENGGRIFNKDQETGVNRAGSIGMDIASGDVRFFIADSNQNVTLISTSLPSFNSWYMVSAVFDSGDMRLYIDGTQQATGTLGQSTIPSNTGDWRFGVFKNGSSYYDGDAADIRVYSDVKTSSQLSTIYNNT